jgi:hypothetical protein
MPIVETHRGPVAISPEARDALLDKLRPLDSAGSLIRTFNQAGYGEVELDLDGKRLVVEGVSLMSRDEVDPQLAKLRGYLVDELTGAV